MEATKGKKISFLLGLACVWCLLRFTPAIAQPADLIGHWRLDENKGTVVSDASGRGHAGTLSRGATWVNGRSGTALSLDGKGGFVRLSMPNATAGRTRAAWIYPTSTSGYRGLISNGDWVPGSLHFRLEDGQVVSGIYGGTTINAPISERTWHHVATTYDSASGAFRIYIDGAEAAAATTKPGLLIQGEDFIGNEYTDGRFFQGMIDDVRIYDRALQANEILALYTGTSQLLPPDIAFYASPEGSSNADGSPLRPYTLAQALSAIRHSNKRSILLKQGIYRGPHNYRETFDFANPVVIRPESGASAMIEGSFYRFGGGIRWQNLEFGVSTWKDRTSDQKGSAPTDIPDNDFNVLAKDQFINCIIHDHNSNGFWSPAEDVLVYGNLFYNQGWQGPDRGHGHASYMQNQIGTKQFKRNVWVSGFSGLTVHAYSENGKLSGFNYEENVSIRGLWLVGGYAPVSHVSMTENHIYGDVRLGYGNNVTNQDATLKDNVILGVVATRGKWTGLSQTGTIPAATLNRVYVYDNAYDPDRGMVVIYNAAKASAVRVNLSNLPLTKGKRYKLLNSLNPAQAYEFTYDGTAISVPMTSWSVARPVSWRAPIVENTFPSFGTFLLISVEGGSMLYRNTPQTEDDLLETSATDDLPTSFELGESYPNPFGSETTVPFSLSEEADVRIRLFDLLGRRVATIIQDHFAAGQHQVVLKAANLPSGIYLIHASMEVPGNSVSATRKVTLVK